MSASPSEERPDAGDTPTGSIKKRRAQTTKACNRCREKKIRCDGRPGAGTECSQCLMSGKACVFSEVPKKRRLTYKSVEDLEAKVHKMEGLLARLYPGVDLSRDVGVEAWTRNAEQANGRPNSMTPQSTHGSSTPPAASGSTSGPQASSSSDEDYSSDEGLIDIVDDMGQLSLNSTRRFFGKSSGVKLLKEVAGSESHTEWKRVVSVRGQRRPDFWLLHSWEKERLRPQTRQYEFPSSDYFSTLVNCYFRDVAPGFPVIHRPTFLRLLGEGLHFRDGSFATVVLLVCANGSRYAREQHVLQGDIEDSGHRAGWRWFDQVTLFPNRILSQSSLYDLQTIALAMLYLHDSSPPQECWALIGMGVRLAQDAGAHRRRRSKVHTVEDESWKRVFWGLLMFDIWMSSHIGRPCAITEEEYDVDFPIECDDEYWENPDPSLTFKQPPGKPSVMAFWILMIRINLLHSYALRTIYSLNRKAVGKEQGWEVRVISELDSSLNRLFQSIPDHLRWDPPRMEHVSELSDEQRVFLSQSAILHVTYYYVQITIHRPLITSPRDPTFISYAPLAMCANAARTCSHIFDEYQSRMPNRSWPTMHLPAFCSALVLLLRLWSAKRLGVVLDPEKELGDIDKCVRVLESAENRWSTAGRYRDLITELIHAGDLSYQPESAPVMAHKHGRSDEGEEEDFGFYHHAAFAGGTTMQQWTFSPMFAASYEGSLNLPGTGISAPFTGFAGASVQTAHRGFLSMEDPFSLPHPTTSSLSAPFSAHDHIGRPSIDTHARAPFLQGFDADLFPFTPVGDLPSTGQMSSMFNGSGQLEVGSDTAAMWATIPPTFQSGLHTSRI
ncbi:fungal-specific transcription factor domain-containing protein [Gloeopeniophorella convolvens]|nr:fungal-specific transcription factor domain-containing protein [Gloeopeniophorella convolvens]